MVALIFFLVAFVCRIVAGKGRPNVIMILADDLGYGDLSVAPFVSPVMNGIKTPALEEMARNGVKMTNFHVASPVCSPSRASIMSGLFSWRLGVDFIYAGDLKNDGTEEIDHEYLPMMPNIATSLRGAGYYTAHIGKWHLGGQSQNEIPIRHAGKGINTSCVVPGINQHGFDDYVGMSEGTGSDRYKTHQAGNTYSEGYKYLVKNDAPMPVPEKKEWLTDRQTDEALAVIKTESEKKRPFYLNIWYDAPHSPWEAAEPFYGQYERKFKSERLRKYASMVSNLDMNVGRVLALLDNLGIAHDTLVVFLSDNGPEIGAGSPGPYKGNKRLVTEGGIKVPAIWQWKGVLPPGTSSNAFSVATDLYPTLLHAAGVNIPPHIRIDGVSVLPALLGTSKGTPGVSIHGDERMVLWYSHSVGYPRVSAAWSHGYKLVWNDYEARTGARLPPSMRLFDMRSDPLEEQNLLPGLVSKCSSFQRDALGGVDWAVFQAAKGPRAQGGATRREISQEQLLYLAHELHLRVHFFRHLGDRDWVRWHSIKPTETAPDCSIRTEQEPTLSWAGYGDAPPEFCGDDVYSEMGSLTCRCSLNKCAEAWTNTRGGWLHSSDVGKLRPDLSSQSPPASYGSLWSSLVGLLDLSRFKPLCEGFNANALMTLQKRTPHVSLSNNTGGGVNMNPCRRVGDIPSIGNSGGHWVRGEAVDAKFQQRCHARVHFVSASGGSKPGFYLFGGACGPDAPLYFQTYKPLPYPVPLCPGSVRRLRDTGHLDDGGMFVALHDVCLGDAREGLIRVPTFVRPSETPTGSLKGDAEQNRVLLARKSPSTTAKQMNIGAGRAAPIGVIDPLCFLFMHSHAKSEDMYDFSGFVNHLYRRIASTAGLFTLVLPVQVQEGWNAAVVTLGPSNPSSSPSRTASFFLFLGAGVPDGGEASISPLVDKAERTLMKLVNAIPGCDRTAKASSRAVLTSSQREAQGSALRVLAAIQEMRKLGFTLSGPGGWTRDAQRRIKHALDVDTATVAAAQKQVLKNWDAITAVSEQTRKAYIDKVTWKPGRKSTRR